MVFESSSNVVGKSNSLWQGFQYKLTRVYYDFAKFSNFFLKIHLLCEYDPHLSNVLVLLACMIYPDCFQHVQNARGAPDLRRVILTEFEYNPIHFVQPIG